MSDRSTHSTYITSSTTASCVGVFATPPPHAAIPHPGDYPALRCNGEGPRATLSAATFGVPFLCYAVSKLLSMDQLLPTRGSQESLVQWKPGMVVSFMSHTWLRYQHPDNVTGDKFALLKAIVLRAVQGELRISTYYQTWIMTGDLAPKAAALKQGPVGMSGSISFVFRKRRAKRLSPPALQRSDVLPSTSLAPPFSSSLPARGSTTTTAAYVTCALGHPAAGVALSSWRTLSPPAPSRSR